MYVYVMKVGAKCKIGKARDPEARRATLQTGSAEKIELLGCIKCKSDNHALQVEKLAHRVFKVDRSRGEWFSYSSSMQRFVATIRNGVEAQERAAEINRRMDKEFWIAVQEDAAV